ncbi:MAG: glycosyltransferase family 4 protein [Candidatus Micrarchaeota archaeon]|nr:glycosyltransferase family 4 protein [Candidatus Micrarchaeota archaeon]
MSDINVLILGSKEYPFGSNRGDDPIPSGGMEIYVDDLAPELSKLCHLVIVTRRFSGSYAYEENDNIEIHRVPWLRGKWMRNPTFNLFSFSRSLLIAKHVDIIYSNAFVSGFMGLLLAKIFGKKTVFRPAGVAFTQFLFPLSHIFRSVERFVFSHSDAVIFHSEGEKKNAEKFFDIDLEKKGYVILTGFPVKKYEEGKPILREEFEIKGETVITSVARFVPVKGLEYLLEACSLLEEDFKILLVGSGPEEENLKKTAKKLGIEEKVIFAGFRRDIPDVLASSDIFVISSISEGLPTSLLEAMAAAKACVVTDIGLPIEDKKTGLVVSPKNAKALKEALETLMNDKKLREEIGKNAQKFVEEHCTQEKAAKEHLKVFEEVIKV